MAQYFKATIEIEMLTLDEKPWTAEELNELTASSIKEYIYEEFSGYLPENFSLRLVDFKVSEMTNEIKCKKCIKRYC